MILKYFRLLISEWLTGVGSSLRGPLPLPGRQSEAQLQNFMPEDQKFGTMHVIRVAAAPCSPHEPTLS